MIFFLFLSLFSREISLQEINSYPKSIAKDFYIWQYLQQPWVSKEDAEKAFKQVSRVNYKIKKAFKKRGGVQQLKTKKCKIYKVRPLVCRLRPYSVQLRNGKLTLTYDVWFLRYCRGLYLGEGRVDEEYFRYAELVLKYLGFEESVDEEEFIKAKERLLEESLKYRKNRG